MRNTVLLILITAFQVNAVDSYSQNTRLSLDLNNVTVANVLEEIESQSEYFFLFNAKLIDVERKVSVSAQDQKIFDILGNLFNETGVNYLVYGKQIILSPENLVRLNQPPQQQNTVGGKVTDNTGTPLAGVTILVKGTTAGTLTDAQGNYSISLPAEAQVLVFSFVGMKSQEIEIAGKQRIDVIMEEEILVLGEVVAIGYGRINKRDLTGSIATVDGGNIANVRSTQLSQALQGSMPGVMVTRNGSLPGASATIRIRGITTIGENDPLVIVDGIPVSSIDDVNPNDIENMSILKDAASASIYGARAAAGVILITTKAAKAGEINFELDASMGVERPTRWPESVGPIRYLQMFNEMTWNDGGNVEGNEYPTFSQDKVENWLERNKTNPNDYPITDWTDLLINDYATRQKHQLTLTYGGEVMKSRASILYENNGALYDHSNYERIMTRINNNITFTDYLSANVDFSYNNSITKDPSANPVGESYKYAPIYSAMYEDGRISPGKDGSNMYAILHYGGFENKWINNLNGKLSIEFRPIKAFTITGAIAPSFNSFKIKDFNKRISYYDADDPTLYLGDIYGYSKTSLYEDRLDQKTLTKQLFANYINSFSASHNLNILIGYEDFYFFQESLKAQSTDLNLTSFPYLDVGNKDYMTNFGSAIESAYRSFFGRLMYDYKQKYYIQSNFRADASSRFHPDYRWAFFPSVSVGWIISNESFMENISFLSMFKLRGSWGNLGNERIGYYPYQASINFDNATFWQGTDVVSRMTAAQISYAVEDISWETTQTWDVGFDANFINNKLAITFDYYKKLTKDMLLKIEIPSFTGFGNPDQNAGTMSTKGWDLNIIWRDRIGDFSYSASVNLSDFISKMGDLKGTVFYGDKIIREDGEYNEWYGYLSDGLFQTQDEVDNSPVLVSYLRPGDMKYIDVSGQDGIPDGMITPEHDKVLLGGSLPRYMYGGNINLNYKHFGISLMFQGVGKQNSRLTTDMVMPFIGWWQNPPKLIDGNYWSYYNTDEENLNAKYPRLSNTTDDTNNYEMSDYWLFNGAYFRLKNISISYTIPKKIADKLSLNNVMLFTSVTDLFSIDNYPEGWDPEASANAYLSKTFNFGVNVKF